MEKRAAVRFVLLAPVIIRWTDASGAKREDVGRTRDISTAGAFLTCNLRLPVGTKVGLEIHLPPLERNTTQRVRLQATGKVIRVTQRAEQIGVAVRGEFTLHDNRWEGIGSQPA
jgi:PilZ domain